MYDTYTMARPRKQLLAAPKKYSSPAHPDIAALRRRIAKAPQEPGVYRWLDKDGAVLYVGKAKNLRNRLRSYVNGYMKEFAPRHGSESSMGPWKRSFLQQIVDFEMTVVHNEMEAFILETNMIKEYRPKYNVLMKDDKNYLFIRVSADAYQRVETVRRLEQDSAKYFGPFFSSFDVRRMLDMLHEVLRYRACKQSVDLLNRGSPSAALRLRPCIDFQIGRCSGLCAGAVSREEYGRRIGLLVDFLKGKRETVRALLQEQMQEAAAARRFEVAARLRDELRMVEGGAHKQIVTDTSGEDADIVAIALLSHRAHAVVLRRRNGQVVGDMSFALKGQVVSVEEVLEEFLPQFYSENPDIPGLIIVPCDFPERSVTSEWLGQKKRKKVSIVVPERGHKSALLELAEKNVQEKARQEEVKWEAERRNTVEALEGLQKLLDLPAPPRRIEGYDISHLHGTETVGSMVVIINGKAANDQYRSFAIHTMREGDVDDERALKEVLRRRLRHVSGGLRRELQGWEEKEVVIRKACKADQPGITVLVEANPQHWSSDDLDQGEFFVAVRGDEVIGCCRLYEHPTGLRELRSVCVVEPQRGQRLGHTMIRALLSKKKRRKVYIVIDPALEQYYGEVGFRHILKVPPVLIKKVERTLADHPELTAPLVMLYDPTQHKTDSSLQAIPDLIVVDGGKGQLSAALNVLSAHASSDTPINRSMGVGGAEGSIPVIALAKREEEIFTPHQSGPLSVPKDSPALFLLIRLRDEAHRFANTLREKRLTARTKRSILDTIPSIGSQTKQQLLLRFKTIDGIKHALPDVLREIVTQEQYEALKRVL